MKYPSICFDRYKMPRFHIASTDLCLTDDLSAYWEYIKDKKYFSYSEITLLIDFLNSGCPTAGYDFDIPTDEEYEQIIAQYAHKNGICHSYHLASELGFGFYGTIGIILPVEEYNKNPQGFNYRQALGYGVTGSYWCKGTGAHKGEAVIMQLNSCGAPTFCRGVVDNGANIGCSVRLIGRPW